MKQENLIKLAPEEITLLKSQLSEKVAKFIKIEDEKKASDREFGQELGDLWDEIRGLQGRINEG